MISPALVSIYGAGYILALIVWLFFLAREVANGDEDFVSAYVQFMVGLFVALTWPALVAFALLVKLWEWAVR